MSQPYKYLAFGILIGLLASAIILLVAAPHEGSQAILLPTPVPKTLRIHVTGAVLKQGVYSLPAGSRIEDAIQAAGGLTEDADQSTLNLAAMLSDGQKITVPVPGEAPTNLTERSSISLLETDELIDINTASLELLQELPGIGEKKAEAIVAYRQNHGAFVTIEEIQNVDGIGPGLFEDIKNLITVSSSP